MVDINFPLYLTYATGFLSYMCIGAIIAYPSPAFPQMKFGCKPMSVDMNSWLASFDGLFAIPGSLLVIPLMNRYGRKFVLIITTLPLTISWLLLVLAFNVTTVAVGRAVAGLALGMELACLFVYIAEISPKQDRGIYAALPNFFLAVGGILVNLLGNFISWRWNAVMCLGIATLAALMSLFMYETPRWLISQGHRDVAVVVMEKLWKIENSEVIRIEVEDIEANIRLVSGKGYYQVITEMLKAPLWKPLVISQLLIAFQQLTGTAYINSYTVEIFQEATGSLKIESSALANPYYQSAYTWVTNALGSFASIFVIDRFGRRILLISSTSALTLSLAAIGAYDFLKVDHTLLATEYLYWLPLVSLLLYNFCFAAAFGGIPYLLLSELFPLQSRVVSNGLGMFCRNVYFFLVVKVFPILPSVPTYGIYWIFGGIGLIGVVFISIFVPETKGYSLEEIQEQWYAPKHKTTTGKQN